MGDIVLLDDLTINKIAAGEVIERPANVVKELVENSLDAGANKISIEIKNGGKTFIKITDNGKGISLDDIPISLERHATSKIRKVEDLENTYTMGFRGEALASIAAISKLTMISRTKDFELANKIVAEAGEILSFEETSSQIGTTIIVENLFFNTPVRYKFLKQDFTEFKYIKDFITKVSMANLNVSFELLNDGKRVFKSNGNGNIKDIVYVLYGKDIAENLTEVNFKNDNIKITGVIGNTTIAKDNRKSQIFFLNKRNIRNGVLSSATDNAFKGDTGIGKYGFFILNLEMPANFYDVNVHPTKMEVRFKDEEIIYKSIYHSIKNAILSKEFLGNNEIEVEKDNYIKDEYNFLTNHFEKKEYTKSESELINRNKLRNVNYKYLGIIFKTYIVIEIDNTLYLIDQHAAHERVLYERIKENYKNNIQNNSQMMLMPEVFNLTHKDIEFINKNMELFHKYGFDIELFGDNAVKVNGIPDLDYKLKINSKNVFLDILDEMVTNERSSIKDIEERFIATVACKAAVKANMVLTEQEVHNLIKSLLELQNPYTCPHGRPTTIKFNRDELNFNKTIN